MTLSSVSADVISELAGVPPNSAAAELRAHRPEAAAHAQGSYDALFDPDDPRGLSYVERLATALRVATLHAAPEVAAHYRQRLRDAGASEQEVAQAEAAPDPASPTAARPASTGTAGTAGSSGTTGSSCNTGSSGTTGSTGAAGRSGTADGSGSTGGTGGQAGTGSILSAGGTSRARGTAVGGGASDAGGSPRLQAILRHADLLATRPVQARPSDLQALADAGLSTAAIVTLAQVIAFVSFHIRVIAAVRLLGGGAPLAAIQSAARPHHHPKPPEASAVAQIIPSDPALKRPTAFTVEQLAWTPWLQPLELADATPEQAAALDGIRANSPYFRLLAHDARVLIERTATDRGIFYTPGGAPRAERELAAAATSRLNGCIYCASVHARLSAQLSKRPDDIDRLLRLGVAPGTDLELDPRWQAVVDLAVALAVTPPRIAPEHIARLRELGLADLEILDVAQAGAFFAWANRLMLTLGEPYFAAAGPS
jgi:alkylhydroperoxidase domain protein